MITYEQLLSHVIYNPTTGVFINKQGKEIGSPNQRGYLRIQVKGKRDYCHRLAFLYMTGDLPKYQVDHINGVVSDNRWENLRDVPHHINQLNKHNASKRSITGYIGVRKTSSNKYQAVVGHKGKLICLGTYSTPEEAHAVYKQRRSELIKLCLNEL